MTEDPEAHDSNKRWTDFDNLLYLAAFFCVLGSATVAVMFFYTFWGDPRLTNETFAHLRATLGLPAAAAGAFTVVAVFRASQGQIKFEVIGFKFEGAAGPIVMWVMCFLAIVAGLKLLW